MRKNLLFPLFFGLFFSFLSHAQVQEWQSVSDFPAAGRDGVVSFVIDGNAYVGLGNIYDTYTTYLKDFYKYDYENDEWTQIADFPGSARTSAVAFVANNKAYVGTGYDADNSFADFYEYDPSTDTWQSIASIPNARNAASSFVINNTGYVGLGTGNSDQLSDFYKYDATLDEWTAIASVGAEFKRAGAVGFSANSKGYISSGQRIDGGTFAYQDILSYDPSTDTWIEELGYSINLSSLMSNTAYMDEDGLVHILKSGSTPKEVIIDLSDFSVSSGDYYFTDDRDDPVVFYLNNVVIAGLGATGSIFDPVYQNSFQKLVTIEPPLAPTITYYGIGSGINVQTGEEYDYNYIDWTKNEINNFDGNIIYLKNGSDGMYRVIDTVGSNSTSYSIRTENLDPNTMHFVKIVAYRGKATATSKEFSFLSVIPGSKINTPNILSVESTVDFNERQLEIVNFDRTEKVIVERSLNNGAFQAIDSSNFVSSLETKTITFNDPMETIFSSLKYRVRLYDEDGERTPSDYSNEVELNLNSLNPYVGNLEFSNFEPNGLSGYGYLEYEVDSVYNQNLAVLEYKGASDSTFRRDTVDSNNLRLKSYEYDSIEARLIISNLLGADTSNIVKTVTPLIHPQGLRKKYTSVNAVAFSFSNIFWGAKRSGSIVERAVNGGDFIKYDSVGKYVSSYYDDDVEADKEYIYRVYNYGEGPNSDRSSAISLTASNMGVWKKFNGDGLASVIDSIGKISIEHKVINDDDIYFLSESSKKLYKYNLTDSSITKLNDLPDDDLLRFKEVIFHNNIIYGIGAQDIDYNNLSTIYQYDVIEDEWDKSLTIPYNEYRFFLAHGVENKIYMTFHNSFRNFAVVYFDTISKTWGKTEYDMNFVVPTYISHTSDSLLIFTSNDGKLSYSFNSSEINMENEIPDNDEKFYKQGIAEYDNELLYLSHQYLYTLDLENRPYRTRKGYLPVVQEDQGYAFTHNDKLFYGLSKGDREINYESGDRYYRTDLLYYQDKDAPLEATYFRSDSTGIEGARLSWIDSPNDNGYIIKIEITDSTYVIDTLEKDRIEHIVDGLQQDTRYYAYLTAINGENKGVTISTSFRTKNGRPSSPQNFKSRAISSSEILYTWDPLDTTEIPVDSLVFQDYNAGEYVLNISDTSFIYSGLNENTQPAINLYVENNYGSASLGLSNRARTYLNSPEISKINIHETASFYELLFEDKSEYENYYIIFRKSEIDTAFVRIDSISTEVYSIEEDPISFKDADADLSEQYKYYILAEYQGKNEYEDTTEYYTYHSLPSDTISTENAVLSVNPYLDAEISIYPNPVNSKLYFRLNSNIVINTVDIMNVNGKVLKTINTNHRIDLSDFSSGLYFVRFRTNQGETTKKVIKE